MMMRLARWNMRAGGGRRLVASLASLVSLCLLLTACGGPVASVPRPRAASAPVEVDVVANLDDSGRLAFERLARLFEAEEGSRVRVVLRSPADYPPGAATNATSGGAAMPVFEAVERAARGSSPPQIAVLDAVEFAALAGSSRVEAPGGDLAPLLARTLLPAARQAAGGDFPLALPLDLDVDVLYLRRGLLYQPPATWDAIEGLSRVSTAGGRQAGPVAVGQDDADPVVALAAATSAQELAGPAGQAAASRLAHWTRTGDIRFTADPVAEFMSGRAGMALALASALGRLEAAPGGHATFQVSTLPGLPARPRFAALLPYGPAASRAAAARVVTLHAAPENQAFWAIQEGRLPAAAAAYETAAWRAYTTNHPEVAAMADAVAHAPAWPPAGAPAADAAARALVRAARGLPAGTGSR